MHFAAVAYVGESTLEPLRYVFLVFFVILFQRHCHLISHFIGFISAFWTLNCAWCFPNHHRYYRNITANTLIVLEAMAANNVKTLIYSSTCATYGEPKKMPITEDTPQVSLGKIHAYVYKLYLVLYTDV